MRIQVSSAVGSDYFPSLVRRLISVPNGLLDNRGHIWIYKPVSVKGKSFYAKESDSSFYEYYTIYDEKYYNDILSGQMDRIDDQTQVLFQFSKRNAPFLYWGR